jgi:hypothetical protein
VPAANGASATMEANVSAKRRIAAPYAVACHAGAAA